MLFHRIFTGTLRAGVLMVATFFAPVAANGEMPLVAPADIEADITIIPDYPGANWTVVYGINEGGDVSGTAYLDNYAKTVGFLWSKATNAFTTIDLSPVGFTMAFKLSDAGLVVGDFVTDLYDPDDPTSLNQFDGYVFDAATGAVATDPELRIRDITALGDLTGATQAAFDDPVPAFRHYQGQSESFSCFDAVFTVGEGINAAGDVVGAYILEDNFTGAFLYRDGECVDISVPTASYTVAWDINDRGDIVGQYFGATAGGACFFGAFYRHDGKLETSRIRCGSLGYLGLGSEKIYAIVAINNDRVILGALNRGANFYGTLRNSK